MTSNSSATLDVSAWFDDITEALPCGPDLEYDPTYLALDQAVSGRPESEYGETLVAAVPADWNAAEALAVALLARTRDLRVVAHLSRAWLAQRGVKGLADGLALVEGLLERHWQHVHPQLDAGDGDDPTARVNALAAFVDPTSILNELGDAALVPPLPSQPSPVTLKQWAYATGETAAPAGKAILTLAEIEAALAASIDTAHSSHAALLAATASAERIEALLTERVGVERAIDLARLKAPLRRAQALLGERLEKLGAPTGESALELAVADPDAAPQHITSRTDVIAMLDRVCEYYALHEPSSPIPLLLMRARGLVDKSFIDIVRDLAPDGLAQLANVTGAATQLESS
jgi:type VI secretion system protein ImpA